MECFISNLSQTICEDDNLITTFNSYSEAGLNFFAADQLCLTRYNNDGSFWMLNTDPKLMKFYFDNNGLKTDPWIKYPKLTRPTFDMWHSNVINTTDDCVLNAYFDKFNINSGISYFFAKDNGAYSMSFGLKTYSQNAVNKIINNIEMLTIFINHLETSMPKEFNRLNNADFNIAKYIGTAYFENLPLTNTDCVGNKIAFLIDAGTLKHDELWMLDIELTNKEIAFLTYYEQGITLFEIGEKLAVAESTVWAYVGTMKKKLRCSHKNDLMHKIKLLQLIDKLPNATFSELYAA